MNAPRIRPAETVLTAYSCTAKKDLFAQLLALNQEVATNIEKGLPVTAGVLQNYPAGKELVTGDCIRLTTL